MRLLINHRRVAVVGLVLGFILMWLLATTAAQSPSSTQVTLRSLAEARKFFIGAAVRDWAGLLEREPLYAQTLAREFNIVTPEGTMKFAPLRPTRDRYVFRHPDTLVTFAEANGMKVRGHTLVWGQQIPAWLTAGNYAREEVVAILREHILAVAGHFKGRLAAWDVVNEAVGSGGLENNFWLRSIGPEYIRMSFQWAREADPQARLFYNDWGNEGLSRKSDVVYNLVRDLLQGGVPLHGVGLQMHLFLDSPPSVPDIVSNMRRLTALGLEVRITEMDVRVREPITEQKLAAQARMYRDVAKGCLSVPGCNALVLWGFTDRYSWIPEYRPGFGAALIFDESYRPKRAYYALIEALRGP